MYLSGILTRNSKTPFLKYNPTSLDWVLSMLKDNDMDLVDIDFTVLLKKN